MKNIYYIIEKYLKADAERSNIQIEGRGTRNYVIYKDFKYKGKKSFICYYTEYKNVSIILNKTLFARPHMR